jgi:hypothetical protein
MLNSAIVKIGDIRRSILALRCNGHVRKGFDKGNMTYAVQDTLRLRAGSIRRNERDWRDMAAWRRHDAMTLRK